MHPFGIMDFVTYAFLFGALYFQVFLLISFLERRLHPRTSHTFARAALPKTAIIVPCWNEERTVAGTIESLLALDYPTDKLEILVVDDGSTDRTYEIASSYATDPRVRVFHKENGGKHTAMNYGLVRTDAELIGCLDADSFVAPDALLRAAQGFTDPAVAAVTPGIHVTRPRTMLQHLQKVEYRLSIFMRNALAATGAIFITPGPFSIFRTSVIRRLGGWKHGHSTEDLEIGLRIHAHHGLIVNFPQITVYTVTPRTLRALIRQRVRWMYGFFRNAVDYRYMIGNPRYGTLGLLVLPALIASVIAALYFFTRVVWSGVVELAQLTERVLTVGFSLPSPSLELFYINTSVSWLIVYAAVLFVVLLISIGSYISTGSRRPPSSTPIFLAFYSFLVPIWLAVALVRATLRTSVRWK